MTLTTGGQPVGTSPMVATPSQSASSPDPIPLADFDTEAIAGDGRHRRFNFTVPVQNGEPITQLVLRRSLSDGSQAYDYVLDCANATSFACGDAIALCWSSLSCTPGARVAFTVGSTVGAGNPSYVRPTSTYAWKVIGAPPPAAPAGGESVRVGEGEGEAGGGGRAG